jgi:hypothetical protein
MLPQDDGRLPVPAVMRVLLSTPIFCFDAALCTSLGRLTRLVHAPEGSVQYSAAV